jgi:hypothetical protein
MSFVYWSRVFAALVLQCVTVFLLVSVALGIWSQYELNSREHREYRQRVEADQNEAAQEIARRCNIIFEPGQTVAGCIEQAIHAYQTQDTSNKDLKAQQDMALWGLWMFVASAGGLVISVGGLFMLWQSLGQTREAISIDREVGHAQVRAYLSVMPGRVEEGEGAEIILSNSGQSPARQVRHVAATSQLIWPIEGIPNLLVPHDGQAAPSLILGPGGTTTKYADWLVRDDELAGDHLCSYGIIYYEDVFGKQYELRFLAKWETTRVASGKKVGIQFSWIPAPFHNDEIEVKK